MRNFDEEIKQQKLLGSIPINSEEFEELCSYARNYVMRASSYDVFKSDIKLSLALVQIAIRHYENGNYWNNFLACLNLPESYISRCSAIIGEIFINTLNQYGLYICSGENRTERVQNILIHSMVPDAYFDTFCEFMYAFYEMNLKRYYDEENILDEIENIALYIQKTLNKSAKTFVIENKGNCKSYLLLKSTRIAMADSENFIYYDLFTTVLKFIDDYFYDSVLPDENSRLGKNFRHWLSSKNDISKERKERKLRVRGLYSSKPYYKLNFFKRSLSLVVPEQKIREEEYDSEGIFFEDSKNKYKLQANGTGINVVYTDELEITSYDISPFKDAVWKIVSGEEKNYAYKSEKFLFFDEEGKAVSRLRNGKNYILIDHGIKYDINNSDNIIDNESFQVSGYKCIIVNVDDNFCMIIDGKIVGKAGIFYETIIADERSDLSVLNLDLSENIKALYNHPTLSFIIGKDNLNGTLLKVNNTKIRVINFANYEQVAIDDERIGIVIDLSQTCENIDGYYEVIVDEPNVADKQIGKYFLFGESQLKFHKKRYVYTDVISLWLNSTSLSFTPLNSEMIYPSMFNLFDGEYEYKFLINEKYRLYVYPPLFRWKNGSDDWRTGKDKIWYSNLSPTIDVYLPDALEARLSVVNNKFDFIKKVTGVEIAPSTYRFRIADVKDYIINYQGRYNRFNFSFEYKLYKQNPKYKWLDIGSVYRKNVIANCHIIENNGTMGVSLIIDGEKTTFCKIWVRDNSEEGKHILIDKMYIQDGFNSVGALTKYDFYHIDFFQEEDDDFGLISESEYISNVHIGYIDYCDLSNCAVDIYDIEFCGERVELNKKHILRNLKKIHDNTYLCDLYYREGKVLNKYDFKLCIEYIEGDYIKLNSVDSNGDYDIDVIYDIRRKRLISYEDTIFSTLSKKAISDYQELNTEELIIKAKIRRD